MIRERGTLGNVPKCNTRRNFILYLRILATKLTY
jgi:hypothetical protein